MHLWNLLLLLFNLNCLHAMALRCYVTLWQSPALDARVVLVHVHMQAQTAKQTHTDRLCETHQHIQIKLGCNALRQQQQQQQQLEAKFRCWGSFSVRAKLHLPRK